tara:strand:+ start:768 stop:947 length:180 start_codon:yes stop_codon:yes gene_type:complete
MKYKRQDAHQGVEHRFFVDSHVQFGAYTNAEQSLMLRFIYECTHNASKYAADKTWQWVI